MGRKKKEFDIEELKEKNKSGEGYYVTNDALMEELRKSHEKEDRMIELRGAENIEAAECVTPELAVMVTAIATKLASAAKFNYKTKEDSEDCVSYAVMDCLKYWRGFNRYDIPVIGEDGKPEWNSDGTLRMRKPVFTMDLVPNVVTVKSNSVPANAIIIGEQYSQIQDEYDFSDDTEDQPDTSIVSPQNKGKVRVLLMNNDGTAQLKKPNPFAYFTTVSTNGLAKGWKALGYTDLPFSKRVYITDSIYSI